MGSVKEITLEEVRKTVVKWKKGKAAGQSGVSIEAIQLCNVGCSLAKMTNDMKQ